jgi:hypothetical protein
MFGYFEKKEKLMKKKTVIVLLMVLLFSGCGKQGWKEFRSKDAGFSVSMPGVPVVEIKSTDSPLGPLDFHLFTFEREDCVYLVGYTDYPDSFIENSSQDSLLDIACFGAVANLGGKSVENKEMFLDGYPGRSIKIVQKESRSTYNTRLYLAENRLYQVTVLTMKGRKFCEDDKKFMDSFELNR